MQLKSSTICVCLLVLASTVGTSAWIAQGKYHNAEHPGKCFINAQMILSPGDKVKDPNDCATISCNDADGWATHAGCGAVGPPPNCHWDGYVNANDPFPMCCVQKVKCDNPDDLPYAQMMQATMKDMFSEKSDNKQAL